MLIQKKKDVIYVIICIRYVIYVIKCIRYYDIVCSYSVGGASINGSCDHENGCYVIMCSCVYLIHPARTDITVIILNNKMSHNYFIHKYLLLLLMIMLSDLGNL